MQPTPLTLHSYPKAIIHVDCDAFFASVEQALNPELCGKPVITGKERGIAAAMSYEAKRRGVTRGMRLFEIKRVCPDAVILPSDYETYSLYSKRFYEIIRRFTPDVEEYSIDEAFADISGLRRLHHGSYQEIAFKIKETLEAELGITVSIGLSLTKSLAKIASKQNKPSGFTCIPGYELHNFLKDVAAEKVCGFGPNTVELLAKRGIRTVLDYISRPEEFAKKHLGKIGVELWYELRGRAVYPIVLIQKSNQYTLGKTKTFTPPSDDRDFVRAQLLRNMESAFIKLRRHKLRAKTIAIHLTESDYRTRGLYAELSRGSASTTEVSATVSGLFDHVFQAGKKYRRTGIVLSELEADVEIQHDLFEDPCKVKGLREISKVIDRVNELYGKHTLHLGSTVCLKRFNQHLGDRGDVTSRKTDTLKGETFRQHLNIPIWKVDV